MGAHPKIEIRCRRIKAGRTSQVCAQGRKGAARARRDDLDVRARDLTLNRVGIGRVIKGFGRDLYTAARGRDRKAIEVVPDEHRHALGLVRRCIGWGCEPVKGLAGDIKPPRIFRRQECGCPSAGCQHDVGRPQRLVRRAHGDTASVLGERQRRRVQPYRRAEGAGSLQLCSNHPLRSGEPGARLVISALTVERRERRKPSPHFGSLECLVRDCERSRRVNGCLQEALWHVHGVRQHSAKHQQSALRNQLVAGFRTQLVPEFE
jgi:hypothetical protein